MLTDEIFQKEIEKGTVLVDFFASWCQPCTILGPIIEKVAEEFRDKIHFLKANVNEIPLASQALGIEQIPTVILFKDGKPVSGFVGLQAEENIRKWLNSMLQDEGLEKIIQDSLDYSQRNNLKLNPDSEAVKRIANGLLANEKKYGKRYCPCRRVTGNEEEDSKKICPCAFHKEEIEKDGSCFCRLFFKNN